VTAVPADEPWGDNPAVPAPGPKHRRGRHRAQRRRLVLRHLRLPARAGERAPEPAVAPVVVLAEYPPEYATAVAPPVWPYLPQQ
jgi:hypothetical protein